MTTPHHRTRPDQAGRSGSPSLAEIAALTARLRALSAAGTATDEDERAAFLADKQKLLDRIAAAEPDPAQAQGRTLHTHHALIRPTDRPPELYVGTSRGDPAGEWSPTPVEVHEGLDAHDVAARAGDTDELAVRIAALRAHVTARDVDGISDAASATTDGLADGTGDVRVGLD